MAEISTPSVALHVNDLGLLRFAQLPFRIRNSIPRCTDDELDSTGFQSLQGEEIFSSPKKVLAGSKTNAASIQWMLPLLPGVKRPGA